MAARKRYYGFCVSTAPESAHIRTVNRSSSQQREQRYDRQWNDRILKARWRRLRWVKEAVTIRQYSPLSITAGKGSGHMKRTTIDNADPRKSRNRTIVTHSHVIIFHVLRPAAELKWKYTNGAGSQSPVPVPNHNTSSNYKRRARCCNYLYL
jgi:hypothetical protein